MRPRPVVLTALVMLTAMTEVETTDATTPAITRAQDTTVIYKRIKTLRNMKEIDFNKMDVQTKVGSKDGTPVNNVTGDCYGCDSSDGDNDGWCDCDDGGSDEK